MAWYRSTGGGGEIEEVSATAADVLYPKKIITADGDIVVGEIQSKESEIFNVSESNRSIAAGWFLKGLQTIKGVLTSGISAGNIKHGVTIKVGDDANAGRIHNVTGTYYNDGTTYTVTQLGSRVDMGEQAAHRYINTGTLVDPQATKDAETFSPSGADRTISAGTYLNGTQTIKGVLTSGISAGNIKHGATITVGDNASPVASATGTFYNDGTTYNLSTTGSKVDMGQYTSHRYINTGTLVNPSATKSAATYHPSTTNQTISSGTYLTGTQTINKVTTSNLAASNIKHGVTIKVGDTADDDCVGKATGTFYNDGTTYTLNSTGSQVDMGSTSSHRYINTGSLVNPSATQGTKTWTPSTSAQTIAAGTYCSGKQTISGDANFVESNIKDGVSIFGKTGTYKVNHVEISPGDVTSATISVESLRGEIITCKYVDFTFSEGQKSDFKSAMVSVRDETSSHTYTTVGSIMESAASFQVYQIDGSTASRKDFWRTDSWNRGIIGFINDSTIRVPLPQSFSGDDFNYDSLVMSKY